MKIKHENYEKMGNHYSKGYIDKIKKELKKMGIEDLEFVLSEKIHGANFQFYCIDEEGKKRLEVGKRNNMIGKNSFYPKEVTFIRNIYDKKVCALFDLLKMKYKGLKKIVVFGEFYGGQFPKFKQKFKLIQKHIFYNPDVDFYPFDIKIFQEIDGIMQDKYLTYKEFEEFIEKINFGVFAKALFKGTLDECLNYDIRKPSYIPKLLKLPEIDPKLFKVKNLMEGVVIRPYDRELMLNEKTRMMIKYKNKDFVEVKPKKEKVYGIGESDIEITILNDLKRYVTPQRLDNVISKIGEVTRKDFGRLIELLHKDAFEEFEIDFPDWEINFEDNFNKILKVKKNCKYFCSNVIKNYFKNLKK